MLLRNPGDFKNALMLGQRLLGLDVGSKTIGLAISDPGWMVASPIRTLERKKFTLDAQELGKVCKDYTVGGLVIGFPINMDGTEGPMAQSVKQFAQNLVDQGQLWGGPKPILLWDERMSTQAVTRQMLDWDITRQKRDKVVDKMAASYILQGALEALRINPGITT